MGKQYDKAVSMKEPDRAIRECKRGVSHKATPVDWYLHSLTKAKILRDDLLKGRYKLRPGQKVQIYRPKRREAIAPYFRDRVWQQSMCNNGVYEDLTRRNIYDNIACQKGKGVDMAIRRVIKKLQKLHREAEGEPIYGYHLDIRGFFPNTPHREIMKLDEARIMEEKFLPYLYEIACSVKDERPPEELAKDPFGERGTGLGSRINQISQVALLDKLDHEILRTGVEYIRYNDDFLLLSTEKEALNKAKETVYCGAALLGLHATDKNGLFNVKQGFTFIGKRFILTETGKIHLRLRKGAMQDERQTLRMLKADLDAGHTNMDHIHAHYQSWVANAEYAGDAPIRAMDKFYAETFREKPVYKRSRRHLYGNHKKRKPPESGAPQKKRPAPDDGGEAAGNAGISGHPQ